MRKRFVYRLLVYLVLCGIIAYIVLPHRSGSERPRIPRGQAEIRNLDTAFNHFHAYYEIFPQGTNAEVLRILLGENPRKVVFFGANSNKFNSQREFLDPWETPYKIKVEQTNYMIRSAGPNKIFGDKDDLTNSPSAR
jgi:hypothetical protein